MFATLSPSNSVYNTLSIFRTNEQGDHVKIASTCVDNYGAAEHLNISCLHYEEATDILRIASSEISMHYTLYSGNMDYKQMKLQEVIENGFNDGYIFIPPFVESMPLCEKRDEIRLIHQAETSNNSIFFLGKMFYYVLETTTG